MYTTEKFLGKNIALRQDSTEELPLASNNEQVSKIGKALLENYTKQAKEGSFLSRKHKKTVDEFFKSSGLGIESADEVKEKFQDENMSQEDLTFPNNPALYTTVVRGIVERAFRPQLVMNDLIKTISVNPQGMQDLQVPVSTLRTAQSLPSSGDLSAPNNSDYTSVKISLDWIYSYEVVTLQLIRQGIVDIIQDQMFELGDALSRKVDSDIISAIESATPNNNNNSNYKSYNGSLTYARLVESIFDHQSNEAQTDALVTTPTVWGEFMQDSDVITALGYNSTEKGDLFPRIINFHGIKVMLTTQASKNNVYLLDTNRTAYYVEGSGIEMLDGRQSESVNQELIGLKLFGVSIVQSDAVYRIKVNQTT